MASLALPTGPDLGAPISLASLREAGPSNALVLYESDDAQDCDGARTLRLVEHAVDAMQALRARADLISAQSLDLIRLTQSERLQMRSELAGARETAADFQRQAREAKQALAEANLRIREAELGRREAELRAHQAFARAVDAETRMRSLEFYLKKISRYLQTNLAAVGR